jgi:hypothetical protein
MTLDPGQLVGSALSTYLTVVAGLAAISATRAAEEGDRPGLPRRVYRTITRTTLGLGLPAVLALVVGLPLFATGSSGMMTPGAAAFLLGTFALLGLLAAWVGTITMGFVGSALAVKLPPLAAGAVVFLCCSLGAPAFLAMAALGRLLPGE